MRSSLDHPSARPTSRQFPGRATQKTTAIILVWMMAEFLWFALAYSAIIRWWVLLRGPSQFLQTREVLGPPAEPGGRPACWWRRCPAYRHEDYQDAGREVNESN